MKLKVCIVDDEQKSRATLREMLSAYPNVEITGEAESVSQAFETIRDTSPAVVFLDIEMGDGTGFDLLEKFTQVSFQTVFITSFNQYAIRAIKFSAFDYLMKPLDAEELGLTIAKLHTHTSSNVSQQIEILKKALNGHTQKLALPTQDGFDFVNRNDIEYCEASSNYTYLYLSDQQKILVSRSLKEFDELLSEHGFFRVHQSYLINLSKIKKYLKHQSDVVMQSNATIPVSVRRKDEFHKLLQRF